MKTLIFSNCETRQKLEKILVSQTSRIKVFKKSPPPSEAGPHKWSAPPPQVEKNRITKPMKNGQFLASPANPHQYSRRRAPDPQHYFWDYLRGDKESQACKLLHFFNTWISCFYCSIQSKHLFHSLLVISIFRLIRSVSYTLVYTLVTYHYFVELFLKKSSCCWKNKLLTFYPVQWV